MNENIAIKVNNLTKVYHLYNNPQDRLKEALHPFRKSYHHDFYALSDVSFEIKKGETVGIIGKNGAGKSTLLKIITGVLNPTSGSVEVNGKIASLLELGAGFNPEMTGLENIYLNGTLLGFSKEEMDSKIDNILEFADIGEFIYQQVKTYSSGMFARLAFSVAINVEPDILIVDEALAVGDVRFQQKCIRKMKYFTTKGITIIFVSHDIGVINDFCEDVIWLKDSKVFQNGLSSTITKNYFSYMMYDELPSESQLEVKKELTIDIADNFDFTDKESFGKKELEIKGFSFIFSDTYEKISKLEGGENVTVICSTYSNINIVNPILGIEIKHKNGNILFGINNIMYNKKLNVINENDSNIFKISFKFPFLSSGNYSMNVALASGTLESHIQQHWIHDIIFFNVNSADSKKINSVFYIEDKNVFFEENS